MNTTMLARAPDGETPPPAAAKRKSLGTFIVEGRQVIGPELARVILAEANYKRQRKIKPFRLHRHRTVIGRGQWDPDNTIRFARFNGQLILVDGQHRLTAVVETECPCGFIVVVSDAKSEEEVHRMYSRIDVDGNRSVADALGAADPTAGREIGFELRRGAYRAMDILANDFPHRRLKVGEAELVTKEDRIVCLAFWLDELEQFNSIISDGQSSLRQAMRQPGVIAVALATLKHQPERARLFWSQVAANKLLKPGDPEQALVNFLLISRKDDGANVTERCVAQCWNAWFHGRRLERVRKSPEGSAAPIRVAGTPYQGAA